MVSRVLRQKLPTSLIHLHGQCACFHQEKKMLVVLDSEEQVQLVLTLWWPADGRHVALQFVADWSQDWTDDRGRGRQSCTVTDTQHKATPATQLSAC